MGRKAKTGCMLDAVSISKSYYIPYYLILVFFVLAVSIGFTGYIYYDHEKAHVIEEKQNELSAIADLKVKEIIDWREERVADANSILKNHIISGPLQRFLESPHSAVIGKDIITWLKILNEHEKYKEVFLFDAKGDLRLEIPGGNGKVERHMRELVEKALKMQKVIFTDLYREGTGHIHLSLIIPILRTEGEGIHAVGVVLLERDPNRFLYPLIRSWPTPSPTAETLLVRREGDEVVFLNELRHAKNTALSLRLPITQKTLPAAMAVLGKEGIVEGTDYRGVPVIAAILTVPDSPWFIVAKIDKEEVYTPIRRRAWFIAIIVFAAIISAGLSVGFWWRQQRVTYYRGQYETTEALRVLSSRQEAILAAVPDIIMEVDVNKVYTWANRAGLEFFGKDVIGKEAAFYFEGYQNTYDVVQPLFSGNENIIYVESWQRRKDGEKRLLAWWCRVLKDEQGNVTGALSSAQDITERKKTEELVRNILESIDEGFIIIDRDFKILSANRAFAEEAKMPLEDVIGKHCYEISHHYPDPCYEAGENCAVKHVFETGESHVVAHTHYDSKGDSVYIETKAYPMKDASGKVVSAIEICIDITEKKKLEAQLRFAQKMEAIGIFAGGITHDFNNILTAIMGYAGIMQMKMKDDDPLKANVDRILASSDRAAHLTQSLLAFSRKQAINLQPADLNEIIKRVEKLLFRLIGEDIEFKAMLADRDLVIMADSGQIEQILMNLSTNARDAMPKGGRLTIETEEVEINHEYIRTHGYGTPGTYALMSVTDSGMGMDEKTREKIFEPFFTTKDVGKGTGLGLSIVYGIVKQHGGYINCYSEPGKGTTFKIYLPIVKAEKVKGIRNIEPDAAVTGTETVLIAEDENQVRSLVKTVLENFGYKVIEAADGEDAINKFMANKDKIDILFFDILMPKMNGKEAYERIKKIRPDIKMLFASGYPMEIVHKKGLLDKELNFISKPVSPTELLKKVREVLDKPHYS